MKTKKLSVCLVVKNEEKYLSRCLLSVKDVADEIVLVDTGSDDTTVEIARQFTDKVFNFKWRDDFSKARNFALDKTAGDWVLFLDGDEELDPQCITALREKIEQGDAEGYLVKVLNYYESGNEVLTAPDVIFRLFRNRKAYRYSGAIHEQICDNIIVLNPAAKISIAEDITIIHYGYLQEEVNSKNKAERNTRLLEKAIQKNPDNLLDRFHLGVEYFRVSQLDKALQEFLYVYDKADLQAAYAPKLMRYITTCKYLLGNLPEALLFIDEVWLKAFRDHGDLYYLRGIVCKDLGRHAEAYESFKKCLSLPPQPAHYANLYCQYKYKINCELGALAEYFTDKETALGYYMEALRENPRLVDTLARIISILNPKDHPEYTMTALNTVFDLSDPGIKLDLGHIFFREGAYRLAIQCFDAAMAQTQVAPVMHLIKGLGLMRTKQYLPAIRELNLIQPEEEFYVTAQGNLLLYYWLYGHTKKAAGCLKNIKQAGTNPAMVEVLDGLRKGRKITDNELKCSFAEAYPIVSEIFERLIEIGELTKFNEAWQCFAGLFAARPARLLGDLFYKYKFYQQAEAEYRQIIGQDSVDPEIFYCLGKTCWALGSLPEAEKHLCAAIDRGYKSPRVAREAARLYQDLAVKTLEEGLARYPGNKEMLNILERIKDNLIEV